MWKQFSDGGQIIQEESDSVPSTSDGGQIIQKGSDSDSDEGSERKGRSTFHSFLTPPTHLPSPFAGMGVVI